VTYPGIYSGDSISSLTLGPYTIPDVSIAPDYEPDGESFIPVAPGTLGLMILSAFNMTIDYPDRKLFLTPRAQ
jgi:hypothetical protein